MRRSWLTQIRHTLHFTAAMNSILFFFALLLTLSHVSAIDASEYYQNHFGKGTYYGPTEAGNCALRLPRPAMYANLQPVALNDIQYGDSSPCGACIAYEGTGGGSGGSPIPGTTQWGYIMDKCPGCGRNNIDLSRGGDGIWNVKWRFIPCPGNSVSFLFEGSNGYYWKIQARGLRSPPVSMSVTSKGRTIFGSRTDDNFYIFNAGDGFATPANVVIKTVLGDTVRTNIPYMVAAGVVYPTSQVSTQNNPPGQGVGGRSNNDDNWWVPNEGKCVPNWKVCSGPRNTLGTSKCCGPFRCVTASQENFDGKRCEPYVNPPATCTPKWQACTGPKNYWRTSTCCDGFVCKIPSVRPFEGKRCEPA